jgi:hypothetical protein
MRLATGKTHQLRRREPGGKEGGIVGLRIRECFELPAAVIDVVEVVARFAGGNPRTGARRPEAEDPGRFKRAWRTEGVRKIAKQFGVDPDTVPRISRPLDSVGGAALKR